MRLMMRYFKEMKQSEETAACFAFSCTFASMKVTKEPGKRENIGIQMTEEPMMSRGVCIKGVAQNPNGVEGAQPDPFFGNQEELVSRR